MTSPGLALALTVVVAVAVAATLGLAWERWRPGHRGRSVLLGRRIGAEDRARARGNYFIHVQDSSNA